MGSEIKFKLFLIDFLRKVNPSISRPKGLGLLRVDPERHLVLPKGQELRCLENGPTLYSFCLDNFPRPLYYLGNLEPIFH